MFVTAIVVICPFTRAETLRYPLPDFSGDSIHVRVDFLEGAPSCLPEYPGWFEDTVASLTSVTLVIEVPDALPVEQSTWGRIKNLYGQR
jgi:hypothetical protein